MSLKRQKRKTGSHKGRNDFVAFLIALLAFFGISLGNDTLPDFLEPPGSVMEQNTPGPSGETFTDTSDTEADHQFQIHILDVGQGLAVLVETGDEALLYDGGGSATSSFVVSYLQKQGVETLDYCIASHYDADHLSGIIGALNVFEVENLIAPDYEYDTKTYYSFINTATEKNLTIHHPAVSEIFPLGNGSFQILAPADTGYEDENDYSVVIKVTLGESSLLLTGDATLVSEEEMLAADLDLDADVLVLGHHGSYHSTGEDFFGAVSPEYAIISCGADNDYGHPHRRIIDLLAENNTPLYRTDLQGTLCFTMTGEEIVFDREPSNDYATGNE